MEELVGVIALMVAFMLCVFLLLIKYLNNVYVKNNNYKEEYKYLKRQIYKEKKIKVLRIIATVLTSLGLIFVFKFIGKIIVYVAMLILTIGIFAYAGRNYFNNVNFYGMGLFLIGVLLFYGIEVYVTFKLSKMIKDEEYMSKITEEVLLNKDTV